MTTFVFLGPTLQREAAARELDAVYCSPAAVGDVYRAACKRPTAIAIIDGVFEQQQSVWHKEILWAMSEGVHVFGASSIGALRAAELADFGMVGVGQVFSAFHLGELKDDDEVAVAHAAAEHGFRPLSEPMVNIRATLRAAVDQQVLSSRSSEILRDAGKALFYADRDYARICRLGLDAGLEPEEIERFSGWLVHERVDAKRQDAVLLLRHLRQLSAAGVPRMEVSYKFEHTHTWEVLQRRCAEQVDSPSSDLDLVFDELRLRGRFRSAMRGALTRLLAVMQAHHSGREMSRADAHNAAQLLRGELGLFSVEQFREWLVSNELESSEVESFMRDEARFRWTETVLEHECVSYLRDYLRVSGEYAALAARVREKQRVLTERGLDQASETGAANDEPELFRWYFREWLQFDELPDDLAEFAKSSGFRDVASFRNAVRREYRCTFDRT